MFARSLAVAVLLAVALPADDSKLKVKEGDKFPDVPLAAAQIDKALPDKKDAKTLSAADLKGRPFVVFFYPKANTPGCTTESCGFRDIADKFPKEVAVIGASSDKVDAQDKFIADHKLPFALLADTELKLIKELGVKNATRDAAQRVTFVVDAEGKIAKVYTTVTPKDHPAEVLKFVEEMTKKK